MGVERLSFHCLGCIPTFSGLGGLRGSAPLAAVPVGVEASSLSEDQGVRLAPSKTAPDDEVPAAAHGRGLPFRVPTVRKGSGGLLILVLCMPFSSDGMASGGQWPPRGDFREGVLAISRRQNILSRS